MLRKTVGRSGGQTVSVALVLLGALTVFPSDRLTAQSVSIAGRMVRVRAADTTALAGQTVVVHGVGEQRQGPIDSMRTDAAGRFRFVVARLDTGTVYVVSARYQGIGYFSAPVRPTQPAAVTLVVFDTTAGGAPLSVGIRHLVVTRGDQGQKRILDIFQVVNPDPATRVGRDSAAVVWSARLPAGASAPQPGESDVPASAIRFAAGRVDVVAPFPPGLKQVVITYDLDRTTRAIVVPVDQPTERLEVLVEDSSASVSGDLHAEDPVTIENRTFRRWTADSLAAGATPTLTFGRAPSDPRRFGWVAIAAAALALAAGGALALRRRHSEIGGGRLESDPLDGESDERLAAQIAALDDKFGGREAETPPETWASYQKRRTSLKNELARRLTIR